MKCCFIINPVAGKQDATDRVSPEIRRAVGLCGINQADISILRTKRPGHATVLARQAAQSGEPVRLYAVGGDGTFNEVLRGAKDFPNAAVGLLPWGSGNDFLRNYGTREEFNDVVSQLRGGVVPIDLIRVDHGYAAAICSAGLDAKVAYGIPKFRRLPFCHSEMAYKLSILECLMGQRTNRLEITVDGKTMQRDCLMVAVCNGCSYGGGFIAAPECRLDDGVLDVFIVRSMPLLRIAKALPLYKEGRHFKNGEIIPELRDVLEYFPAKEVSLHVADAAKPVVVNVDGECGEREGFSAKVVPLAARIILPEKVYMRWCEKNQRAEVK